jgi:hypothetical protein
MNCDWQLKTDLVVLELDLADQGLVAETRDALR